MAQARALRALLTEIGYADAVIAGELTDGQLQLIDGHLRAETTPDEKVPIKVPVLLLDVTEVEADKLLLTLDPLSAMAEADTGASRHCSRRCGPTMKQFKSFCGFDLFRAGYQPAVRWTLSRKRCNECVAQDLPNSFVRAAVGQAKRHWRSPYCGHTKGRSAIGEAQARTSRGSSSEDLRCEVDISKFARGRRKKAFDAISPNLHNSSVSFADPIRVRVWGDDGHEIVAVIAETTSPSSAEPRCEYPRCPDRWDRGGEIYGKKKAESVLDKEV